MILKLPERRWGWGLGDPIGFGIAGESFKAWMPRERVMLVFQAGDDVALEFYGQRDTEEEGRLLRVLGFV